MMLCRQGSHAGIEFMYIRFDVNRHDDFAVSLFLEFVDLYQVPVENYSENVRDTSHSFVF